MTPQEARLRWLETRPLVRWRVAGNWQAGIVSRVVVNVQPDGERIDYVRVFLPEEGGRPPRFREFVGEATDLLQPVV